MGKNSKQARKDIHELERRLTEAYYECDTLRAEAAKIRDERDAFKTKLGNHPPLTQFKEYRINQKLLQAWELLRYCPPQAAEGAPLRDAVNEYAIRVECEWLDNFRQLAGTKDAPTLNVRYPRVKE